MGVPCPRFPVTPLDRARIKEKTPREVPQEKSPRRSSQEKPPGEVPRRSPLREPGYGRDYLLVDT